MRTSAPPILQSFFDSGEKFSSPMKSKDWLVIAKRYNGADQNGYDEKIKKAYDALKKNW